MYDKILEDKKINLKKMGNYGFKYDKVKKLYIYKRKIVNEKMELIISIKFSGKIHISIKVIDILTNDEYILHKLVSANGAFVSVIRKEIEKTIADISENCFEINNLYGKQKQEILNYIAEKYNDNPEYLWERSPNFIVRRKDNKKWYGVFINVSKNKLGFFSEEKIDILNLRLTPKEMERLINKNGYYPAYHMNKKNWISISLNGELEIQEILEKVDMSYNLVAGKAKE